MLQVKAAHSSRLHWCSQWQKKALRSTMGLIDSVQSSTKLATDLPWSAFPVLQILGKVFIRSCLKSPSISGYAVTKQLNKEVLVGQSSSKHKHASLSKRLDWNTKFECTRPEGPRATAYNKIAKGCKTNLLAMASNLELMASNLIADIPFVCLYRGMQ